MHVFKSLDSERCLCVCAHVCFLPCIRDWVFLRFFCVCVWLFRCQQCVYWCLWVVLWHLWCVSFIALQATAPALPRIWKVDVHRVFYCVLLGGRKREGGRADVNVSRLRKMWRIGWYGYLQWETNFNTKHWASFYVRAREGEKEGIIITLSVNNSQYWVHFIFLKHFICPPCDVCSPWHGFNTLPHITILLEL